MATERPLTLILLSAIPLLWPAFWNGYPLVSSDSDTYLSQAIEHYAGWDRPIFYSLFLLPLHMTLTTWPAICLQALLTAHTLHLVRRTLLPRTSVWWLPGTTAFLAIATAIPWFVAQLMPDAFTGLLTLALALLLLVPDRLSRRERIWLIGFSTLMIAMHQSHLPLALALLTVLLPLRTKGGWLRAALPVAFACMALISANIVAFGRPSLSPFGNVFLLARVIYDGPGKDILQRDCPSAGWRLCAFVDRLPPTSDDFLWQRDGPVAQAGGAKLVSLQANEIIGAAVRAEPGTELRAILHNFLCQLGEFASGDGLQAWPDTVTPWIGRDFPHLEYAAYLQSRQTRGVLAVPSWLGTLHIAVAIAGVAGCLGVALRYRDRAVSGLAVAVIAAVLANAAITGALSTPHHRYQSRIMWLPPLVVLVALSGSRQR